MRRITLGEHWLDVIDMISLLFFQFCVCLHSIEWKPVPTVKILKALPLYEYVNSENEPHYNNRVKKKFILKDTIFIKISDRLFSYFVYLYSRITIINV